MQGLVEKRAFRISEAVYAYGVGRSKIYDLIKDGTLKTVKVGGCTLIPRTELDALISLPQMAA